MEDREDSNVLGAATLRKLIERLTPHDYSTGFFSPPLLIPPFSLFSLVLVYWPWFFILSTNLHNLYTDLNMRFWFLLTHRYFATSSELFDALVRRFFVPLPSNLSPIEREVFNKSKVTKFFSNNLILICAFQRENKCIELALITCSFCVNIDRK